MQQDGHALGAVGVTDVVLLRTRLAQHHRVHGLQVAVHRKACTYAMGVKSGAQSRLLCTHLAQHHRVHRLQVAAHRKACTYAMSRGRSIALYAAEI